MMFKIQPTEPGYDSNKEKYVRRPPTVLIADLRIETGALERELKFPIEKPRLFTAISQKENISIPILNTQQLTITRR